MKEKKSIKQQQIETARKKKADSIKYLYFSRYLMVRYSTTGLLFANLFWLIFCFQYQKQALLGIALALIMTVYASGVSIEQLSKMHNHTPDVPVTRVYLIVQIIVNVILGGLIFTPLRKNILPFVTDSNSTLVVEGILLIGILICIACEIRIHHINTGKDKYKHLIETFKKQ